jgi:hypothetical protein
MHLTTNCFRLLCCLLLSLGTFGSARAHGRATILYDAFGNSENLKKDWGFSVLIEYSGKKILFDTGNNSKIFSANAKALDVDSKDLDFVVISHRHGDHTRCRVTEEGDTRIRFLGLRYVQWNGWAFRLYNRM